MSSSLQDSIIEKETFGIELKKYFKFNSSHIVAFDGFREPMHGHNYKVSIKLMAEKLNDACYLTDFDNVKNIMSDICSQLKHKMLLPANNKFIKINFLPNDNIETIFQDGSTFTFPKQDVLILNEINQISSECLSKYITIKFVERLKLNFPSIFHQILKKVVVKVYEDKGKCGIYKLTNFNL